MPLPVLGLSGILTGVVGGLASAIIVEVIVGLIPVLTTYFLVEKQEYIVRSYEVFIEPILVGVMPEEISLTLAPLCAWMFSVGNMEIGILFLMSCLGTRLTLQFANRVMIK